jgi:RNA polymerase sigma factor (sigma-70 family)
MLGMSEPAGGRTDLDVACAGDRRAREAVLALLREPDRRDQALDEIARRAAAGSDHALELLLAAIDEHGLARSAIRRLVLDPPTVDDINQDVLIVVAEKIGTFRGESRFTTWLYRVARFKSIDHLRRQRESVSLADDGSQFPTDAIRMSSLIANRTTIRHAVDELPDHYRDAVVLRDIEGLPYEQVAERSGIPLNTAKTRVARGRALVAAKLTSDAG